MQSTDLIGQIAPELEISAWLQGETTTLSALHGKVVLVTVFQLSCPGSFLHALPEATHLHMLYASKGLRVIGLATAFEDFATNTLDNLSLLVNKGELVGESLHRLSENCEQVTEESILKLIKLHADRLDPIARLGAPLGKVISLKRPA